MISIFCEYIPVNSYISISVCCLADILINTKELNLSIHYFVIKSLFLLCVNYAALLAISVVIFIKKSSAL